jgi:hypothetical protein
MQILFLQRRFTVSVESSRFASSTATPWGYKTGLVILAQPTSSRMISLCSSSSSISIYSTAPFTTSEKRAKHR